MYVGWTQVAFASELSEDVVPVDISGRTLIAVRGADGYQVFDGRCPHRGAHLGYGGRLDGCVVVCPFHGHRVHLGEETTGLFRVGRLPSVAAARGLFVLLDDSADTGLTDVLRELDRTHHVVEAFSRPLAVPPEYVVENVLDADHFATVHGLERRPRLEAVEEPGGVLRVEGVFETVRPNQWQVDDAPDSAARARFCARVFSPTVVVSELGPAASPNLVITAATPAPEGGCLARVTVALPRRRGTTGPTVRELSSLVSGSRTAFDQDAVVWEHLDTEVVPQYTEGDRLVLAYRDYCRRFLADGRPAVPLPAAYGDAR